MIDNELQPTKDFVLYTTPNGKVKLEVFPKWKYLALNDFHFGNSSKRSSILIHSELLEKFDQFRRF